MFSEGGVSYSTFKIDSLHLLILYDGIGWMNYGDILYLFLYFDAYLALVGLVSHD